MDNSMRKYIAEFLGTFTLVFVGTSVATLQGFLTGYGDTGWLGISLAFGCTLMVLVWVIGPVSGCHVNPAVTFAMVVSGRQRSSELPGYVVSQCLGAIAASAALLALLKGIPGYDLAQNGLGANGNPRNMSTASLFGWELAITALFVFTIFSATRPNTPGAITGLAIGGFLLIAHLIGAQLGDASLNPARSLGPALFVRGEAISLLWVFVGAPLAGSVVGWILYRMVYEK